MVATPSTHLTFLVTEQGRPFSPAGFGNKFRDWCNQANLRHCSAHGLRKATAARLAERGATAHEIMAITGHQSLEEIGYRKGAKGGTWISRHYSTDHGRRFHAIGTADDVADADGAHVLSFAQAQEAARKWFAHLARHDRGETRSGPFTVRECVEEYLMWLQAHRKTGYDALHRVHTHI